MPLYGPSGAGIWSAPTIDAKRGLLYTATGNAYGDPAPETSDAVLALNLESGAIEWVNQVTPGGQDQVLLNPDFRSIAIGVGALAVIAVVVWLIRRRR